MGGGEGDVKQELASLHARTRERTRAFAAWKGMQFGPNSRLLSFLLPFFLLSLGLSFSRRENEGRRDISEGDWSENPFFNCLPFLCPSQVAQLAVDQGGDRLAEVQGMLSDTETTEENYKEKMARQNLVLMNLMYDLYRKTRKDMVVMKRVLGEFCQAYFYTFFLECPDDLRPRPSDDYDALLYKFSQLQFESLNSVGTLDPPPQPFAKTLLLTDQKENCTARDPLCPVTTLRQQGTLDVDFSDWWGSELLHKDRVRVDRVRLYLRGTGEDFVVLQVTQPAVFNDTYLGQVYTFLGPASQCFVMYEDSAHASMGEASYVTDCSTHANYDRFYSRATPFGSYTVTPVGETVAAATSALEVLLEGSWMPRTKVESAT